MSEKKSINKRRDQGVMVYVAILLICMLVFMWASSDTDETTLTYQSFVEYLQGDTVTAAYIYQNQEVPTGYVVLYFEDGTTGTWNFDDVADARELLLEYDVTFSVEAVEEDSTFLTIVLPIILGMLIVAMVVMLIVTHSMNAANGGGNNSMLNFGKSRAKMVKDGSGITFANVAGLAEEKEDLEEIVDFLKNPGRYTAVGARIPKGVILVGPPGTGKTLLAKAVAGEAGVPFFSISGSDFVEMFVGVGASRVRDLFEQAKENAPCIVFIDEIDAVGRRRGTGLGGGHDEREQTLNQLLVEMDGFGRNSGIIVMAATNRVDILDPAIMRPGRFDRKIAVGYPDVKGREEILALYSKDKPLGDDVDLHRVAMTTPGFTGADLENLMNESAILAAKEHRIFINQADIDRSFVKVGIGAEKKSKVISQKDRLITAYHESGHAILFHVLPDVGPVHTISIIPTGMGAAGYTMPVPERDEIFNTKGRMLQEITVDLGGRIAEELIFDDVTTGASQDIKQATETARKMVTEYGMSDRVGMICYGGDDNEVFIGRDLAHAKSYGEGVASTIDEEVKRIIDSCYDNAKRLLTENIDILHASAKLLLEKEKITGDEFAALFVKNERIAAGEG